MFNKLIFSVFFAVFSASIAYSQTTTYKDKNNRTTGTSSTNSSGTTTYKDANNRTTGTKR
jgi:hypothetical protein